MKETERESTVTTPLGRRHGWLNLASMAITLPLAILLLSSMDHGEANLEEFALHAGTTSVFESEHGHLVHGSDVADLPDVIAGRDARQAGDVGLWLGNSQLHAINQWREGDVTAIALARTQLATRDIDLIGFSEPNASLQEHYVLFEYLRHRLPVKVLVLPLVFDDTRETGIRPSLSSALTDADTEDDLSHTAVGRAILASANTGTLAGGDFAGLNQTVQDSVERKLNSWLGSFSTLWSSRPQLRGTLFTSAYRFRNQALGIKATSKRRIIRGRYTANLQALDATLASAADAGIAVITYIAPLRDDVEPPYVSAEYARFKADVERIAHSQHATFVDLEHLVPASLWGEKDATNSSGELELDFMHFQEGGHELLAAAISRLVLDAWHANRETHE